MLYDILTVALLVGGCLLLWLNLRPRQRDVLLTPKEPVHQEVLSAQPAIPVRAESPAEHRVVFEDGSPKHEPVRAIVADPELDTASIKILMQAMWHRRWRGLKNQRLRGIR